MERYQRDILNDWIAFLTDLPVFNTMLNWVTSSSQRTEAVGSEVMHHLTSTVSQSQPDTCVLCDSGILSIYLTISKLFVQVKLQYKYGNEFNVNMCLVLLFSLQYLVSSFWISIRCPVHQ